MTNVYLARPIDTLSAGGEIIEEISAQLGRLARIGNNLMYSPADAFAVGDSAAPNEAVWEINQTALANSDGVVAVWPASSDSFGTGVEIGQAIELGLRIALITDRKGWSVEGASRGHLRVFGFNQAELAWKWVTTK